MPNVTWTRVARPFGKHALGQPLLRRKALAQAKRALAGGGTAVANGGNAAIPDVNWVHYVHAAFAPVVAGSPLRKLKAKWYNWHHRQTEREALHAARVVICNSRLTQRHVIELIGLPEAKTRVVYLGCDAEKLKPITADERHEARRSLGWDERPWAIFIGALGDRRKGFDILFDAWKKACERREWDANLAVIGRGAELAAWQQRVRESGLENRVRFLGFRNDVPHVLAACDLLIHPARYESYGMGVHEAICRGLPVIVSAQTGVAEKVDSSLAELILPNAENVDDLLERMLAWRKNLESMKEKMIQPGERLRQHTWTKMATEFVEASRK
jgi:glycosyltransferase involved in cell wall biosynthesis